MRSSSRERSLWGALLVLALWAGQPAYARAHHSDAWAREHFAAAERMCEALNGRPPADRTRHDYQRVVNAYRAVYMGAPTSSKADPSVVAVAETLVEMGRRFEDDTILNKAIEQYKFLRREYPGSKYRADGLFTVAEIYKDDLNNSAAARATFQEFLRHYPRNRLADDARQAILEIDQPVGATKSADAAPAKQTAQSRKSGKKGSEVTENQDVEAVPAASESLPASGHLARVTGIRHWSAPDYTRVAIDLESDVKFSSQRIATPARIFFDLNGTKLASTLVGKSFDVDDGFLKKVRVAQFTPGRTRVVLEVDNLSDYDAFLLPNPSRLIIDIHGKNWNARQHRDAGETSLTETEDARGLAAKSGNEVESSSPEPKAAAIVPAASADTVPNVEGYGKSVATVTRPEVAVRGKNSQAGVVKKIVDADNDGDAHVSTRESAAKGNVRTGKKDLVTIRKAVASKEVIDNDDNSSAEYRPEKVSALGMREARPTVSGDRSLIRALGLKIGKIVIDPGHGGHDTGTIGPNGLEEKDLVLEVGRRLGKLLETRLGAEVVYTRKDDTFIPLETRTAIANQARADLFVSIHANSSHDPGARGVETYYLNFTSSPEALEVAARENAVSEKSIYELQDLVKKIALKEKIEESREFAGDVQSSLHSGLAVKSPAIRDRGVKKAPFIVLIGANMPSILAEISFVSNPTDEHRLATSEYRERIAESLYRGIAKYVNGLSGVKVASKMDKGAGQ